MILVPGPVVLQPPKINPINVTLNWEPPAENRKCISHYNVFITGPLGEVNSKTEDTATEELSAFFPGLYPCGRYSYEVVPISLSKEEGKRTESDFETTEASKSLYLID